VSCRLTRDLFVGFLGSGVVFEADSARSCALAVLFAEVGAERNIS
jgi:hypothetical protein